MNLKVYVSVEVFLPHRRKADYYNIKERTELNNS